MTLKLFLKTMCFKKVQEVVRFHMRSPEGTFSRFHVGICGL